MKKLRYIKQICIVALLLALGSCNTMDPIPTNDFTDANFWTSPENAELIVNMAYNQMYSADKMWNDEALSDNVFEGRTNTDQRIIRNGIADPSLGLFDTEWEWAYGGLKTCHVFLQFIDIVPGMTAEHKERRKAEVRFIRAHLYFRLVNFYGDVPFFTSDVSLDESQRVPRTSKEQVMSFIHQELDEIIPLLPSRNQLSAADNGRITSGAAVAFQARAYLYESNWSKVIEYGDKLINQGETFGNYSLFPSYAGLFEAANEYNQEVILDYAHVPSVKYWSKYYDAAPLSAGARLNAYAPLQELVDSYLTTNGLTVQNDPTYNDNNPYTNRDPRLAASVVFHGGQWTSFDGTTKTIYIRPGTGGTAEERMDVYINSSSNSTATGYYMRKYYDQTAITNYQSGLNIIMYRYADVLLMYAEALNEQNDMDENAWNNTIGAIRERAGFTNPTALSYPSTATQAQLREIIRNERRSELALEGLRYYDIIRWKAGTQYLNGFVHGAKFANGGTAYIQLDNRRFDENRDYLWSVPRAEMDINNNLRPNNPGYGN
ncbi:RagB/SusD family nutrient uptake outer membrane protein [Sphingobacterium sp. DN00404]|uniref:RagB/SusD family nutrient uptake outer membrane protein n=1 Tax=Sphingobacterium micropteri TaxID=2763501 RepID=A0ABR7YTT9_9SPHI|nr:RagB/SusD family nutrient uptake outer membrane protein [Sphingobacterium micropteri]MBD1434754.1 RagB/SusD family nutrient uptake outer membrane protein [Sphingobacterium micropteri]